MEIETIEDPDTQFLRGPSDSAGPFVTGTVRGWAEGPPDCFSESVGLEEMICGFETTDSKLH